MQTSQIEFVKLAPEHLDGALALSRQAKWPHRLEDWAMLLSLSTGFVALNDGKVAGTTLLTRYGNDVGAINMVIVDEALRGQGIGRRLMDAALAECGDRECRLTATSEGLPLYKKLGFVETGAILQHQGVIANGGNSGDHGPVVWATSTDLSDCTALDHAASGLERSSLISRLAEDGRIAVLRRDGRLLGFAALRTFGRGELAGPVVATTLEEAKALLSFLFAARPGAFMRVDTNDTSGLAPWLADHGLAHVGGGISMRKGGSASSGASDVQTFAPPQTFALASQALG